MFVLPLCVFVVLAWQKIIIKTSFFFLTNIIPQKEPLRLRSGCSSLIWERNALYVKTSWPVAHSCLNVVTLCFYSSPYPQIYQKICVTVKYQDFSEWLSDHLTQSVTQHVVDRRLLLATRNKAATRNIYTYMEISTFVQAHKTHISH